MSAPSTDPFARYAAAVDARWTAAECLARVPALGCQVPATAPRTVPLDGADAEFAAIHRRATSTRTWFEELGEAQRVTAAYRALVAAGEWYPPLVQWQRRGDELAVALQRALAARERVAPTMAALREHVATHGALARRRDEHAALEVQVRGRLATLEPLLRHAERWQALVTWQKSTAIAVERAVDNLLAHTDAVAADLQALTACIDAHARLLREHQAQSAQLAEQLRRCHDHLASAEHDLQRAHGSHGSARTAAVTRGFVGAGYGFLIGSFSGCSYGCVDRAATLGEGALVGLILGVILGAVIGAASEHGALTGAAAAVARATNTVEHARAALGAAQANLEQHRALTPVSLQPAPPRS